MKKVILLVVFLSLEALSQIVIGSSLQNEPLIQSGRLITYSSEYCGDIVISEIMADPSPPVSLPEDEYVEIYNRSANIIDLDRWQLCVGDQCVTFSQVEIKRGEYLILCSHTDTSKFRKYGRVIGFKSFPSLPGEKGTIYITDSKNKFVHGIEYSSDWYNNKLKEDGGWSLEMKDTDFPFFQTGTGMHLNREKEVLRVLRIQYHGRIRIILFMELRPYFRPTAFILKLLFQKVCLSFPKCRPPFQL